MEVLVAILQMAAAAAADIVEMAEMEGYMAAAAAADSEDREEKDQNILAVAAVGFSHLDRMDVTSLIHQVQRHRVMVVAEAEDIVRLILLITEPPVLYLLFIKKRILDYGSIQNF